MAEDGGLVMTAALPWAGDGEGGTETPLSGVVVPPGSRSAPAGGTICERMNDPSAGLTVRGGGIVGLFRETWWG